MYMQLDQVKYTGDKFAEELSKKTGTVVSHLKTRTATERNYVVEFPKGDDVESFIMPEDVLAPIPSN